jgi:hypothetical protein
MKHIFTSESLNAELKYYPAGQKAMFQIDCELKGDILIEVHHVTSFYRYKINGVKLIK